MSDSLPPHGLQHARLFCPPRSPRLCSNSWPFNRWCHPTISSSAAPSSLFSLSQDHGLFQWVGSSHQVPKVLELQIQYQSFNEYSGFISFRIGWFDFAVQGTLKSPLQHKSKLSVPQCSAFFMIQLLHPYMTTGKSVALTVQTFVGKVMSLLFNKLSRLITGASLVA